VLLGGIPRTRSVKAPISVLAEDPFSKELLDRYDKLYPGSAMFTAGSACSGMYRGLRLWEAAVREAGSVDQEDVIGALDHAKIAVGPGGPAEMVPGQHHVRMNMYIAQVRDGAIQRVVMYQEREDALEAVGLSEQGAHADS
jgi:ABC-type branched-subunit amino acid transport system substrate-binding protein